VVRRVWRKRRSPGPSRTYLDTSADSPDQKRAAKQPNFLAQSQPELRHAFVEWRRECQSIPVERSSIFGLPRSNPRFEPRPNTSVSPSISSLNPSWLIQVLAQPSVPSAVDSRVGGVCRSEGPAVANSHDREGKSPPGAEVTGSPLAEGCPEGTVRPPAREEEKR
jgi:hypothetical protein